MNFNLEITKGKGLGKKVLGFATANAILAGRYNTTNQEMLSGAWVSEVIILNDNDNKKYRAVTGICYKDKSIIFETHILDFDRDIYNKRINLQLLSKIRDAKIFKNLTESKEQLINDIEQSFCTDTTVTIKEIEKEFHSVTNAAVSYKSCITCKFFCVEDYGYSNYTVEGSTARCLLDKIDESEFDLHIGSTNDIYDATNCHTYNVGEYWHLDCDGEDPRPTTEWIKEELRNLNINKIIE